MKTMKPLSLAETGFLPKAGKQTRQAVFLSERERVVPGSPLEALIEPFYPKRGNGRPPMPLGTMLRIHFLQPWFGYSDPVMEEASHDIPLLRPLAGLDAFEEVMPAESTILRFRHLLEQHARAAAIFAEVKPVLAEQGLTMKRGSVVDATLMAAPHSTQNQAKQRDPERSQTQKGNPWYFGLKAHLGVDAKSGLGHTVACTTAQVADHTLMKECWHGEETLALGDRGYPPKNRTLEDLEAEDGVCMVTSTKKPKGGELTEEQKRFNRMLSAVRALVEHPFRVVKPQFGLTKVRYRGLKKNTGPIVTLFALANLWLARHRWLPWMGEVRP
jgi:IS5 family transposase